MRRRQALAAVGASAVGLAVTSGTATAATRPDYIGLQRGVAFTPELGSDDTGEATRVDTNASEAVVEARGAITYRGETQTTVEFAGFDDTPSEVDVALFDVSRGDPIGDTLQTVSFVAKFEYASQSDVDDFFVDLIGDTVVG